MKFLKMLVIAIITVFTFGGAMGQDRRDHRAYKRARYSHRHHYSRNHHRYYRHR